MTTLPATRSAGILRFLRLLADATDPVAEDPGRSASTFKVRVFSKTEFEATVKANERHFMR